MTQRLSLIADQISSKSRKPIKDPVTYFGFDSLLSES
jgi:hypothetical protein